MSGTTTNRVRGGVTVELVSGVPEHIRLVETDEVLCGSEADADARLVAAEDDPLSDASVHLCPECVDAWLALSDDIDRASTVRCVCDRAEDGSVYKCGDLVRATDARALTHPVADGPAPVCPSCYEWLRNHPQNPVETPYEDAPSWVTTED
jgi:hypothetical protein